MNKLRIKRKYYKGRITSLNKEESIKTKMVIKRYSLIIVLAFLLMINSVVALKTVVTMTTSYPDHNITINVLDVLKEDDVLTYLNNGTDSNGITTFTFDTEGKKDISIHTIVRKNGKIIIEKRFDDLVSGEPIDLEIKVVKKVSAPAPTPSTTPVQNTTAQNISQNITNQTNTNKTNEQKLQNKTEDKTNISIKEEESGKITGAASSSSSIKIPSVIYYVIGAIVLVVIIIYALRRAKPYFSFTSQIKESSSAVGGGRGLKKPPVIKDKELEAAERKIREAEEEIGRIKERNTRIVEAERKFHDAQRELDRLKKGF